MLFYYFIAAVAAYLAWLASATNTSNAKAPPKNQTEHPQRSTASWLFVALLGLFLSVVAGLRWNIGTDYGGYRNNYLGYKAEFWQSLREYNEPGIRGLALLASKIADDYATYLLMASLITVGLFVWTIAKNSNAFVFSILIFIFIGSWHGSFNGVRQYLAVAIVFAGHGYIVSRNPLKYAAVVFVASLFHVTALAAALLYLVPRRRLRLMEIALLLGVAMVALYSSEALLRVAQSAGQSLDTPYATSEVNRLRVLVAMAPAGLYFLHFRIAQDTARGWFYRNLALVHPAVVIAASWSAYLSRIAIYTNAFLSLSLPLLVVFQARYLTAYAKISILALYAYYWFYAVSPSTALVPFHWIFERVL